MEGLTQTALNGGAQGSSAGLLPGRSVGERRVVCGCMWDRPAVGACRPLGLGCSSCCARPRDLDAHLSPRAKRSSVTTCTTAYAH